MDAPIYERALIMHILNGLTYKFDFVLNTIKHRIPFTIFAIARSMLLSEESCLKHNPKPSLSHQ